MWAVAGPPLIDAGVWENVAAAAAAAAALRRQAACEPIAFGNPPAVLSTVAASASCFEPNQSRRFFLVIQTDCKHFYSFLGPYINSGRAVRRRCVCKPLRRRGAHHPARGWRHCLKRRAAVQPVLRPLFDAKAPPTLLARPGCSTQGGALRNAAQQVRAVRDRESEPGP